MTILLLALLASIAAFGDSILTITPLSQSGSVCTAESSCVGVSWNGSEFVGPGGVTEAIYASGGAGGLSAFLSSTPPYLFGGVGVEVSDTVSVGLTILGGTGPDTGSYWTGGIDGVSCDENTDGECVAPTVPMSFVFGQPFTISWTYVIDLFTVDIYHSYENFHAVPVVEVNAPLGSYSWTFSQDTSPVPEPHSLLPSGIVLAGLGFRKIWKFT